MTIADILDPVPQAFYSQPAWGYVILGCAAILLLNQRNYYFIFPYLIDCAWQWRGNLRLEASVPRTRVRNLSSAVTVLPLALVFLRFDVLPLCLVLLWWLLRTLVTLLLRPKGKGEQYYDAARRSGMNYFILYGLLVLPVVGGLWLFHVPPMPVRVVLLAVSGLFYLLFLVRKTQILRSVFRHLTVFLYLCALEIIPSALLVAATVLAQTVGA